MRILKLPEVESRVGYKSSSIYAKVQKSEFPRPITLGPRAVGWLENEIDEWIAQRDQQSRPKGEAA